MTVPQQIIIELSKSTDLTPEVFDLARRKIASAAKEPLPPISALRQAYLELCEQKIIEPNKILDRLLRKREVRTLSGVAIITTLLKPFPCPGKCTYCPLEARMPKSYIATEPACQRALHNAFDPFLQVQSRLQALANNGHPIDKIEMIIKGGTWSAYTKEYQTWFITRSFEACNEFQSPTSILPLRGRGRKFLPSAAQGGDEEGGHWYTFDPTPLAWQNNNFSKENFVKWQTEMYERLKEAQDINETATCRIIGLTLETRPDWIDEKEIAHLRKLGATRIELGVQTTDNKILERIKRGHDLEAVKKASKLLHDAGFKCDFHIMPQLPGSTPDKDVAIFETLFSDPELRPDMVKIYPCAVLPNSELYLEWQRGEFKPYSTPELIEALIKIKTLVPRYCRISRLIRDIPSNEIADGNKITNLREFVQTEMKKRGLKCNCLRCREIGHNKSFKLSALSCQLFDDTYEDSGGQEHFLSIEDQNREVVFAFCRLRLPNLNLLIRHPRPDRGSTQKINDSVDSRLRGNDIIDPNDDLLKLLPELNGAALIRELHTYGHLISLNKDSSNKFLPLEGGGKEGVQNGGRGIDVATHNSNLVQHTGLGRQLMTKAEDIARAAGYKKMAVISGIGVREYYRKLGYELEGTYMVKQL